MQKQLNNFSREQANLRFESFQISPSKKKKKLRSFEYNIYFSREKYLKIQFPIIEEKANNSTIIKYKLRDKWIVERVGKLLDGPATWKTWSKFPQVRLEAQPIWPHYRK